jgi:hypothetical protein
MSTAVAKFYSNKVVTFNLVEHSNNGKQKTKEEMTELAKLRHKGCISKAARKSIVNIIDTWNTSIKQKIANKFNIKQMQNKSLSLITLTLSETQKHDDKYIKRNMFNHFIITIGRKYGVKNYVWKCEYQKNGNIHFHIVVDTFIKWESIRATWNAIQLKHGYLDKYFEQKHHYNANSTDIHTCRGVKNVKAYIIKYLLKKGEIRENAGRIWGCSDNLKTLVPPELIVTPDLSDFLNKVEELETTKTHVSDYSTTTYFDVYALLKKMNPTLYEDVITTLFINTFNI